MIRRPSGEKSTECTGPRCPWNVCSSCPSVAFHKDTEKSADPNSTCVPSGEKVTEVMALAVGPVKETDVPDWTSVTRAVVSAEPDTALVPSGENLTE